MTNAAQAQSDGWFWPGPNTGASVRELRPGEKALVLFLDPVSLVVAMPPLPGGEVALARFCRLLARAARQLAASSDHDPSQASITDDESQHQKDGGSQGQWRKTGMSVSRDQGGIHHELAQLLHRRSE
jgi:hypothetical protein